MAAAAIIEITKDVMTQFGRKLSATSRTGVCISAKGISVSIPLKISDTPPYEPSTSTKLIANPSGIFFEGFFISPPNSSKLIKPANEKYPILAATTVNGLILGYSRDILVIAEARIFPSFLSTKTKRFNTPANAIITYTLLSVLVVLLGSGVEEYALVAVIGLLLQQLFIAVSLYRIPRIMKDEYESAEFKLPKPIIKIVSVLLFLISAAFITMHPS